MGLAIKPSDLYYKYPRKKETRDLPKFSGLPDATPFDRDDLYEVIPMFEAVMNAAGSVDGAVLQGVEELMIYHMPQLLSTREEVYTFLVTAVCDRLGKPYPVGL
ncbi:MAG: hypothetical protein JXR59_05990 [Desulfuromonadaceae bacterium]|nr:hypothetical protein [Desulfuromonadaceae bacterium]